MSTNFNLKFLSKIMELEDDNGVNVVKKLPTSKTSSRSSFPISPQKMESLTTSVTDLAVSDPQQPPTPQQEDLTVIIPDDCWFRILSYVDAKTLASFGLTSRRNFAVHLEWFLWYNHFMSDYGVSHWRGSFDVNGTGGHGYAKNRWERYTPNLRPDRAADHLVRAGYRISREAESSPMFFFLETGSWHPDRDQRSTFNWRQLYCRFTTNQLLWTKGVTSKPKKRFLVVGPKGSGKSSLLAAFRHYQRTSVGLTPESLKKITPPPALTDGAVSPPPLPPPCSSCFYFPRLPHFLFSRARSRRFVCDL